MIGDVSYQVTDLERRLKVLENKARAVNPGNAPSRGPDHPLRPLTSEGQLLHGADSDLSSRITTALQAGLTDLESVQDVNIASKTINFGGGATQNLYQTNYVRPDPIVGDTYRVTAGGNYQNGSAGALSINLTWAMTAGGPFQGFSNGNVSIPAGLGVNWWLLILATVIAAGASGTVLMNGRYSVSSSASGLVAVDSLVSATINWNLVAPVPTIQLTGGVSASLQANLFQYSLERLGAGFASKA